MHLYQDLTTSHETPSVPSCYMSERTLIKNGTVVLPSGPEKTSLLIEGSTIAAIDVPGSIRHDHVVDATGLHVLPGVIDDQVHFRDPGLTHKEDLRTGSLACAKGGVTSFLDMPNTNPQTITVDALHAKLELASTKAVVNYGFYIGATSTNLAELRAAQRTPGIKIFIGSSTGNMLVDEQEALEAIFADATLPITAHCEDESTVRSNRAALGADLDVRDHSRIRDHRAALIATKRAIDLAHRHNHRFHVLHVSTAGELEPISDHRNLITAEACPHHLFFDTGDYDRLGSLVQMNPSVKDEADRTALWQALHDGVVQIVATDHAPHTLAEKSQPYPASPSGVPAVELLLPLFLNEVAHGRCTLSELVAWMSDGPARIWDMINKGRLQEGYDADVVLVDLNETREVRNEEQVTRAGWSPWAGQELTGWPIRTWVMGQTVFANGRLREAPTGTEIQYDRERGGYWATGGTTAASSG